VEAPDGDLGTHQGKKGEFCKGGENVGVFSRKSRSPREREGEKILHGALGLGSKTPRATSTIIGGTNCRQGSPRTGKKNVNLLGAREKARSKRKTPAQIEPCGKKPSRKKSGGTASNVQTRRLCVAQYEGSRRHQNWKAPTCQWARNYLVKTKKGSG